LLAWAAKRCRWACPLCHYCSMCFALRLHRHTNNCTISLFSPGWRDGGSSHVPRTQCRVWYVHRGRPSRCPQHHATADRKGKFLEIARELPMPGGRAAVCSISRPNRRVRSDGSNLRFLLREQCQTGTQAACG